MLHATSGGKLAKYSQSRIADGDSMKKNFNGKRNASDLGNKQLEQNEGGLADHKV